MADQDAIARPYAKALFDLARESNSMSAWAEVLEAAAEAVGNDDVIRLLHKPGIDAAAVASMIADVCREAVPAADGRQLGNLLRLLAENRRLSALPAIRDGFDELKSRVENVVDVTLTAPVAVDEAQQARIVEALKRRLGKDVNLHFKLDEKLIGGARLQADDLVIDGSIRTGLEKLTSTLVH